MPTETLREGLCFASVCSDKTGEEAAREAFPSGTRLGWQLSSKDFPDAPNGCPCPEKPGYHHYLLEC